MSQPDEQLPRTQPADTGAPDPVSAMRSHIADLESELATTVSQVDAMESEARDFARRATEAIEADDLRRAHDTIVEWSANSETRDEEVGVLKADIRVLRVLLAECYAWLETPHNQSKHEPGG